jgi:hypothetical protein
MGLATVSDPPIFYMTVHGNRREIHELVSEPNPVPAMRNALQFQNKDALGTRDVFSDRYVLDSGGYSAMEAFNGEFPWTVEEYHHWARAQYRENEFDWVATMDLACEPGAFCQGAGCENS